MWVPLLMWETDYWFLFHWTTVILLATISRKLSLPSSTLVTHFTYGWQNRHERQFPNRTFRLFNLYKHGSVFIALGTEVTGSITPFHLLFDSFSQKIPIRDSSPRLHYHRLVFSSQLKSKIDNILAKIFRNSSPPHNPVYNNVCRSLRFTF
jgi:hypothetical protein